MLIEAKGQVAYGGWGRWLKKNFELSDDTARRYMRWARQQDEKPSGARETSYTSPRWVLTPLRLIPTVLTPLPLLNAARIGTGCAKATGTSPAIWLSTCASAGPRAKRLVLTFLLTPPLRRLALPRWRRSWPRRGRGSLSWSCRLEARPRGPSAAIPRPDDSCIGSCVLPLNGVTWPSFVTRIRARS